MKVYIAARFKGAENKHEIEALCTAVRHAGLKDFSFVRDVEHYKHTFDDPKELWARAYDEIGACDAFLVDVSDYPTGGRVVEAGIAYALRKPVIVVKRHGVEHKGFFDGISAKVITYSDHKDLTQQLKRYEKDRNFNLTDKSTLAVMFLMLGGVLGWMASQYYIPLGLVVPVIYWFVVRQLVPTLRAFDRVVIYIPLIVVWIAGYILLEPLYLPLALAWVIVFWIATLFVLRKAKLSL